MSAPADPILYCHPDSGFSYKAALALSMLGIEFEQRHIAIWKPREERSVQFRAASVHGEVPVLQIDGHTLCQSNVILDYLARREQRLDGRDEAGRLRVREWLSWEANRVGLNVSHARFGRRWGEYHAAVLAWYDGRAQADLARMDAQFADTQYLAGAQPTVADVACCGYLFYTDEPWAQAAGIDWSRWPRVRVWREAMAALPGFATPQALFAGHDATW